MHEGSEGARGLTCGFCEVTLEARDTSSSLAAFYKDLFGWQEPSRDHDRVWLACGGRSCLGLWTPGAKEFGDEGGRHVHLALSVHPGRLCDLVDRLGEQGIAHRGPIRHEGGDHSVYFEDPEGNVVAAWDFFAHGAAASEGVRALASAEMAA